MEMVEREEKEEETRDRITDLAAELKQLIMSSLSMKDAIAASCVSNVWRYAWVSLTAFDFGPTFLKSTHPRTLLNGVDESHRLYQTFRRSTLSSYNLGVRDDVGYMLLLDRLLRIYIENRQPHHVLKKLSIYVPMVCTTRGSNMSAFALDVVSRWFSLVKDDIEELSYHVDPCRSVGSKKLEKLENCNAILRRCKRLIKLELLGCSLTCVEPLYIRVPCLKQLTMLHMSVENKTLDFLLHKCLALEELKLSDVKGVKVIRIPKFSKLKKIKVMRMNDLDLLEIDAMTLQCLTLIELNTNLCKVKVAYHSRKNLEELFINGCAISDEFFNYIAEFPNLKDVFLMNCPLLKSIKIKSNGLARFSVKECSNLSHIELDAPKVLFFGYTSTKNNDIVSLLSKCYVARVTLHFKYRRGVNLDCLSRQSKLLALLAQFKSSYIDLIISQALRESFSSPLCGVQYLSLWTPKFLPTNEVLQYLDNLLWLSHHPRKISLSCKQLRTRLSVELQWESCGRWRPILKDFRIVDLVGVGYAAADSIGKLLDTRKVSDVV